MKDLGPMKESLVNPDPERKAFFHLREAIIEIIEAVQELQRFHVDNPQALAEAYKNIWKECAELKGKIEDIKIENRSLEHKILHLEEPATKCCNCCEE